MTTNTKLETKALHAGQEVDPTTLSRAVPVYRTASYVFKNAEHAANLFALKELGNIYSRLGNPTQDVLEKRVAELEGGAAAVAVASGTAAIFNTIINLASAGDEIIAANNLYGGTYTQFNDILPQLGINVKFVGVNDFDAIKKNITDKTKAVYIETIGNPSLEVADIRKIADIAHEAGLPLVVDSTFATPYLIRPIEHGADIVIHSLTKWLGGHGTAIGGIVVDSGNFKWKDNPRFDLYNKPDSSYHGLRWGHDLGDLTPIAFALRFRTVPLRNLGACISPDNAWAILQGIETLHLRLSRHCENTTAVANYLDSNEKVKWVRFPGLDNRENYNVAKKYLKDEFGGVVVFGIEGGREAGEKFIDNLKLFSHLANVGDAKSLALHPASTSHSQISEEEQLKAGVEPELIRLSIGLENIDDILADIQQALDAV